MQFVSTDSKFKLRDLGEEGLCYLLVRKALEFNSSLIILADYN